MTIKPIPSLHQGPKKRLKKPIRLNFPPGKLERYQEAAGGAEMSLSAWLELAADAYPGALVARALLATALPADRTREMNRTEIRFLVLAVERALERLRCSP